MKIGVAFSFPLWQYPVVATGNLKRAPRKLFPELRAWMRSTGTRQAALARLLGVSPSQVCRVFAGSKHFTPDQAFALSRISRVPVEKLLTDADSRLLLKFLGEQSKSTSEFAKQNDNVA